MGAETHYLQGSGVYLFSDSIYLDAYVGQYVRVWGWLVQTVECQVINVFLLEVLLTPTPTATPTATLQVPSATFTPTPTPTWSVEPGTPTATPTRRVFHIFPLVMKNYPPAPTPTLTSTPAEPVKVRFWGTIKEIREIIDWPQMKVQVEAYEW